MPAHASTPMPIITDVPMPVNSPLTVVFAICTADIQYFYNRFTEGGKFVMDERREDLYTDIPVPVFPSLSCSFFSLLLLSALPFASCPIPPDIPAAPESLIWYISHLFLHCAFGFFFLYHWSIQCKTFRHCILPYMYNSAFFHPCI